MSDDADDDVGAGGKAPDAFRTISEVAEDLGLPQHVLRFWETRFTQVRPMKRGGGRRYYRPNDVELLRGIRHLLYDEGYTIKGVQRLLREQGLRFVAAAANGTVTIPVDPAADEDERPVAATERRRPASRISHPPGLRLRPADETEVDESPDERIAPEMGDWEPDIGLPPEPRLAPALAADEKQRLQAVLADLLECKRLLDQAR